MVKNENRHIIPILSVVAVWVCACVCPEQISPYELNQQDKEFLFYVYSSNEYKLQLSSTVLSQGNDTLAVISGEMIRRYRAARQSLLNIAANTKFDLTADQANAHLASGPGIVSPPCYDVYARQLDSIFEQDEYALRKENSQGTEPSVKAFANNYKVIIASHQQLIDSFGN